MGHRLSISARVDLEKRTPRCLKKPCQTTQDGIRTNLTLLMEPSHERMLEQLLVAWEQVWRQAVGFAPSRYSLAPFYCVILVFVL